MPESSFPTLRQSPQAEPPGLVAWGLGEGVSRRWPTPGFCSKIWKCSWDREVHIYWAHAVRLGDTPPDFPASSGGQTIAGGAGVGFQKGRACVSLTCLWAGLPDHSVMARIHADRI